MIRELGTGDWEIGIKTKHGGLGIHVYRWPAPVFREQLISQLRASPYEIGLLVNFGAPKVEYIRLIRSKVSV